MRLIRRRRCLLCKPKVEGEIQLVNNCQSGIASLLCDRTSKAAEHTIAFLDLARQVFLIRITLVTVYAFLVPELVKVIITMPMGDSIELIGEGIRKNCRKSISQHGVITVHTDRKVACSRSLQPASKARFPRRINITFA